MDYLPYWVTEEITSTMNPLSKNMLYKLMPPKIRKARLAKQCLAEAETLVLHNVENLRWAILQNLRQAFRQFPADLEARLEETMNATQGVIAANYEKRRLQTQSLGAGTEKIKTQINTLEAIQSELKGLF